MSDPEVRQWPSRRTIRPFKIRPSFSFLASFLKKYRTPKVICDAVDRENFYLQEASVPLLLDTVTDSETGGTYLKDDERYTTLRFLLERLWYYFRPEEIPYTKKDFEDLGLSIDVDPDQRLSDEILSDCADFLCSLFNYSQDSIIKEYLFVEGVVGLDGVFRFQRNFHKERIWVIFDLLSIPYRRLVRGSLDSYRYIFSSIFRHGGVYLVARYVSSQLESLPLFPKRFRLTDFNLSSKFLPMTSNRGESTRFPHPYLGEGVKNYDDYFVLRQRYDTGHVYDTELFYDMMQHPQVGKSLHLELTLDRILVHKNTIGTQECLCDLPYLDFFTREAEKAKRLTEKVYVGCQMGLLTTTLGFYALGDIPYTIPAIKAKFQVIPSNWNKDSKITKVRLGVGRNDSLFRNTLDLDSPTVYYSVDSPESGAVYGSHPYTDPSNPPIGSPPENSGQNSGSLVPEMVAPVMSTTVGDFEYVSNVYGFRYLNVCVHKNEVTNYPFSYVFNQRDQNNNLIENVIKTNVEFITPGSVSLSIYNDPELPILNLVSPEGLPISIEPDVPYGYLNKCRMVCTQYYDKDSFSWKFRVQYQVFCRYIKNMTTKEIEEGYLPISWTSLYEYRGDEYRDLSLEDYILQMFGARLGESGVVVNYRTGDIRVDLVTPGMTTVGRVCEISFISNSKKDLFSLDPLSGVVVITEMGCYNAKDELVAYAVFPPVIIDSDKHHISFDLFFKDGLYEETSFG